MAHLIDKDAVVAEIDALLNDEFQCNSYDEAAGFQKALTLVKKFIDTLELKEVDLEKYYHDFLQKEWFGRSCVRTVSEMMAFTAKHFFELGLKAHKGE